MKTLGVTSVLLLTLVLATPSVVEAQVLRPNQLCSDHPDAAIATFEDANLEARVRAAVSVGAQEDLTCGLVSGLMDLDAERAGIESLVGIQNLTSLTFLSLHENYSISDISALSGLTSLTHLDLDTNSLTDISPLRGLTSLTFLDLQANSITDLSALSGLTSLTDLRLDRNSVTDISALSGLTSLTVLRLDRNSITDISALSELTGLTTLSLEENTITDLSALSGLTSLHFLGLDRNTNLSNIQPLLANQGLGPADEVRLQSTNVSCTDVALLKAKGVRVDSYCP